MTNTDVEAPAAISDAKEPIIGAELALIAESQARTAAAGTVMGPHCEGTLPSGRPCRKLLALQVSAPWVIECPRCGHRNGNALA